jgi:hypothetical protein
MKTALALLGISLAVALPAACGETATHATGDGGGDAGNTADAARTPVVADATPMIPPGCGPGHSTPMCPAGQDCCFDTSNPNGTATSSCVPQGSCSGSVLSCQGTSDCQSGQICCFNFTQAGAAGAGGGPFTTACTANCEADAGGYQLCTMDNECPSGVTCAMGVYTTYCMAMMGFGGGGGFPGGGGGGFPGGGGVPGGE